MKYACRLNTASNGEKLLSFLHENPDGLPDVIFLDLNMPRKNGFVCLEEIKNNPALKNIPVIILTTVYDNATAEKLYSGGAMHYIKKPAELSRLTGAVAEAVARVAAGHLTQPPRENFLLPRLNELLYSKPGKQL